MNTTTNKFAHLVGDEPDVGGRPTKYMGEKTDKLAHKLALLGLTDAEMAEFFGVAVSTFHLWKLKTPSFSDALEKGKKIADANVAASLYDRAIGYEHPDTHISTFMGDVIETPITKKYAPDVGAIKLWLSNRTRNWKDKQNLEHTGADGKDLNPAQDATEIARRLAFLLTVGVNTSEGSNHG